MIEYGHRSVFTNTAMKVVIYSSEEQSVIIKDLFPLRVSFFALSKFQFKRCFSSGNEYTKKQRTLQNLCINYCPSRQLGLLKSSWIGHILCTESPHIKFIMLVLTLTAPTTQLTEGCPKKRNCKVWGDWPGEDDRMRMFLKHDLLATDSLVLTHQ